MCERLSPVYKLLMILVKPQEQHSNEGGGGGWGGDGRLETHIAAHGTKASDDGAMIFIFFLIFYRAAPSRFFPTGLPLSALL